MVGLALLAIAAAATRCFLNTSDDIKPAYKDDIKMLELGLAYTPGGSRPLWS